MPRRPCIVCGHPCLGTRCPKHKRPGYDAAHRAATARAIAAEPWCHAPGCEYPDVGTPANPLTGQHPLSLAECGYDTERWRNQERIAWCHRCNSSRR